MRITVANASSTAVSMLQHRQQQMAELQRQVASGRRVDKPSDDPAAAARAERALATMQRNEANMRGLLASRTAMQMGEAALGDATEMVQQARELVVRAGNGTLGLPERQILAQALRGLRDDLLAAANRSDGAGRYLFGGQGGDGPPLRDTPTGVVFNGSPGLLQGDAGETTVLAFDGQRTFLEVPDPANAGQTVTLFRVLDDAIAGLADPVASGGDVAQTVTTALAGLDSGITHLSAWRSRAGEALKRIDAIEGRLAQQRVDAEQARSEAEDVDMVAAITSLQTLQSSYDAALKTYSMVQRMSLFDYLR